MAAPKLIDVSHDGPQRIGRYDLVAEIASGGMATVYLANLSGVGGFRRFVAIKRLHPHLAKEQEFVEMFLDEARLAAGIHDPHVVPILEVGASERGYYLVMEYIEGDTLARLLARAATSGERLPATMGSRIIIDMLRGLHSAHELRDERGQPTELVHRDVSPQNILVGIDGNTRITDFGVARAASRLSATRAGQLKGKIAYMAPEQAVGDPTVDRRADVFSAGIVLWEVLAARRLFKAENEAATLARVISEPIPNILDVNPALDPKIAAIVMRALERDRATRYSTCEAFADDFEEAARAAGQLASTRDVAGYVTQVIGQDIEQQREAVRAWLARSEPSQASPPDAAELSLATVPPPISGMSPLGTPEQSGMIAAPLGAPLVETGGRSRVPLIIAGAAIGGFLLVGIVVMLIERREPVPSTAPSPNIATLAPRPAETVVPPSAPPVTVPPSAAEVATAAPADPHQAVVRGLANPSEHAERVRGEASPRSVARVGPARREVAATPASRAAGAQGFHPSAPKAEDPGADIDLSSPYR